MLYSDQNFVRKVRTIWLIRIMFTGYLSIQTWFQGWNLVKVRFRIIVVRVRGWRMHYVNDSPHKYRNTRVCVSVGGGGSMR